MPIKIISAIATIATAVASIIKDVAAIFKKNEPVVETVEKKPTGKYTVEDVWNMSYQGSYSKLIDDGKGTEYSGVLGWNAHPYAVDEESKTVFFNTGGADWSDTPSPYVLDKLKKDGWRIISSNRELDAAERQKTIDRMKED